MALSDMAKALNELTGKKVSVKAFEIKRRYEPDNNPYNISSISRSVEPMPLITGIIYRCEEGVLVINPDDKGLLHRFPVENKKNDGKIRIPLDGYVYGIKHIQVQLSEREKKDFYINHISF
jgi:hypothetical protein